MDKFLKPINGREYFSIVYGYMIFIWLPIALFYIFFISNSNAISFLQIFLLITAALIAALVWIIAIYIRLWDIFDNKKKAVIFAFGITILHFVPIIKLICELFLVFKKGTKKPWAFTIKRLGIYFLACLILFISFYGVKRSYIVSKNMTPTLQINDKISSIRIFKHSQLKRGDIVIAKRISKNNKVVNSAYRIVGLPHETIKLEGDKIFINDSLYNDLYAYYNGLRPDILPDVNISLGTDEYYLLGDNRYNSYDSRFIGTFKRKDIISKVISIYWPIGRRKYVNE